MKKKFVKRIAVAMLIFAMAAYLLPQNLSFINRAEANTTKYGFSYDESYYNVSWKAAQYLYVYSEVGGRLGTMTYYVGLARRKSTNDYIVMMKEVMTPNKSKVKINSSQYGYGLSEYVSVKTTLPSLDNYYPQNDPGKDSISFSIGVSSEKKAEISASYTVTHSDLDITASCNTPNRTYYIIYDYDPSIANPFASNKYVANESVQMGEAQFETSSGTVSFVMNYDARFGAAENANCSPWLVYLSYVRKTTGSRSYSFTISR